MMNESLKRICSRRLQKEKDMFQGEGATELLVEFVRDTKFSDLPSAVVHDTKRIILDSIACAVGGYSIDAGKIVVEMAHELGGAPMSTILANGAMVSPASAAFANTALGNALDADETFLNSGHHAVCAVFPALSIVESRGLSGKDLITSVALGFDVGSRVGLSLTWAKITETGAIEFAPKSGLGWLVFSAVAAAGKALGLDKDQLANALGIAGYGSPLPSASRWGETAAGKPMLKYAPYSFIGLAGVMAAQMAQKGYTGDRTFLDGYWKLAGTSECNWDILIKDLGKIWWISSTSIKPYASCRWTHYSLDLFLKILNEQKLRPEEIEEVIVDTFSIAASPHLSGVVDPETQIDMQFSIPFVLAVAAHGIELTPQWQSTGNMKEKRFREFARRVKVHADSSALTIMSQDIKHEGRFKRIPTKVTVSARGKKFTGSTEYAWGDPWTEETRMTDEQLAHKFRAYCSGMLRSGKIEKALDMLNNLESVGNVSMELMSLLR